MVRRGDRELTRRCVGETFAYALVASVAVSIHLLANQQPMFWDEYYHLLSARSWAGEGSLAIADGSYDRAAWVSISVGMMFRVFGESLLAARVLPGIALVLWACGLFFWVRHLVGRGAAWASAVAFVASPLVLMNGTMIRWYGVSGLLLFLGMVAVHRLLFEAQSRSERAVLMACLLAALAVSYLVTELALVWVLGLGVFFAGTVVLRLGRSYGAIRIATASGVSVALLSIILWKNGAFAGFWESYRWTPLWSLSRSSDLRWYETVIRNDYPTLWSLFPIAATIAYRRSVSLTWLCVAAWMVSFLVLSGAGAKAERYLLPVLPYFFVIWGIALAELAPQLRTWACDAVDRMIPARSVALQTGLGAAVALISLLFIVGTNPGFLKVRAVVEGETSSRDRPSSGWGTPPSEWEGLALSLGPRMADVDVIVTANSLQTLYHIGDFDYSFRPIDVVESDQADEFGIDPRTGRVVAGTIQSLRTLVARHPTGLVFGEQWRWGGDVPVEGFSREVEEYIENTMEPVPTPPASRVRAYTWGTR